MLRRILVSAALALLALGSQAAGFPEKPVHIVVAYPAGSTMDGLARLLAALGLMLLVRLVLALIVVLVRHAIVPSRC